MKDYQEALRLGEVLVAYARVMMVGPGGVGKSSLLRGLMNQRLPQDAESTILADTKVVKRQFWAKAGESADSYWAEITDEDEIEELAGLFQLVLARLHPAKAVSLTEFNPQECKPQNVQTISDEYVSRIKDNEVQSVLRQVAEQSVSLPLTRHSENLHSEVLMHVWDCGGQPVFLDVLPAFLTSRTMFLLFFDARRNLLDKCSSLSYRAGRLVSKSEQSFTTLQLLTQWMASIHAMCIRKDGIEDPNLEVSSTPSEGKSPATQGRKTQTSDPAHDHIGPQISARNQHIFGENIIPKFPRIIPVGTHGDEIQEDEKILHTLLSHCEGKAFAPLLLDGVIVDNTTAGHGKEHEDEGFRYIREQVHELTSEHLKVRTPVAWVLFRKVLQKVAKANPIVSYRQAVAVGQACGMAEDVVPSVLHFYHELAVFLHYFQIRSLCDQVIADPQWLVKQLGRLLAPKELEQNVSNQLLWKPLHEKGILIQPLYEEVWKKSILEPQSLADLLEHFLLVAPIDPPIAVPEIRCRKYFVPSVLQLSSPSLSTHMAEHRMCNTTVMKKSSPLHLTFSTKYVPPGFFTRLATTLTREPKCEPLFERDVFRNKITFAYDQIDELTICEQSSSVQINVVRIQHRKPHKMTFGNTCCDIMELIQACSATVGQWLPSVEVKAAFLCEQCPDFITIPHGANTGLNVYCKARHHCNLTREKQYWLKITSTPEALVQKGDLSDTELQEVACDIQRDRKLKELADELEMVSQLQSLQHSVNASLTLLYRWRSEIQNAVEAHSLLVHHLKCIGLTETSDRLYYREFLSSQANPTAENKGATTGSDRACEIVTSVDNTSRTTRGHVLPHSYHYHPENYNQLPVGPTYLHQSSHPGSAYPPQSHPGYPPPGHPDYPPQSRPGYPPPGHPDYPPQSRPGYPPTGHPSYPPSSHPGYPPPGQQYPPLDVHHYGHPQPPQLPPTNSPHHASFPPYKYTGAQVKQPGTKPTLPELLRFTCTDGRVVSLPVEIATKYVQFGTLLLDDQNGSKVKIIARKNHYDAEQINIEILQEWLTGRGKNPVTWTILVEVLRGIELSTLAGDIKAVKCPGRPTQKYHS